MNLLEQTKSIEIVPKRKTFKARFYNNAELKNKVDFGRFRDDFSYNLSEKYTTNARAIKASVIHRRVGIVYSPNLILQAFLTQPENDSLSFLACCWINSSKSSSNRICFIVLFERSKFFFSFLSCIGSYLCGRLYFKGSYHYIGNYLKKAIPRSVGALSRDLTKPLKGVMIMANRYDSAHLRARQFKLFKFYDLSTTEVLQVTATTEREARKQLGKKSLIFISRRNLYPVIECPITLGGYNYA